MEQEPNQGATGEAPVTDSETGEFGGYEPPAGGQSPLEAHAASDTVERPEVLVAAAFVGGFATAQILRWLGNR
ncbi:MAG: hypothetical protein ABR581_02975 [Thermoleophilaceae bacterium]